MRLLLKSILGLFLVIGLYLFFAPVAINPQPWDAPINEGYTGQFAANNDLANLTQIELPDGMYGPEDVVELNGVIYVSTQNGWILTFNPDTAIFSKFAETGGKPLGLEVWQNTIIVADAYEGLLQITEAGEVSTLTESVGGNAMVYVDDLDVTDDGIIYFSDASTKFGAKAVGSTLAASLLEIMEHGQTGRVVAYNLNTKETFEVAGNLSFSNGVAIAPDGNSLWVVETGKYRILEMTPEGQSRVIIDNLPGFPDNINRGPDGTYFVGLVSKRSKGIDSFSDKPFLRKMVWRLPSFIRPSAQDYGFVIQLDSKGKVLRTWQDPAAGFPATTGAIVAGDRLYVSSLTSKTLGYRPYP